MKWTISFITKGNYFKVVNEGLYEAGDSIKLYASLFSNESWHPGASILMDNRQVDYRNVNYQVMSQSSNNLANSEKQIANSKIGYVVESPVGLGISRQFQMLMEGKSSIIIEIFTNEEAAINWLTREQKSLSENTWANS